MKLRRTLQVGALLLGSMALELSASAQVDPILGQGSRPPTQGGLRCDWPSGRPRVLGGSLGPTGKTGVFTFFDEAGRRTEQVPFVDDRVEGIVRSYWPSGLRRRERTWRRGRPHGPSFEYHENGVLEVVGCAQDGLQVKGYAPCTGKSVDRVDPQIFYDEDGRVAEVYAVRRGRWNGPWVRFFPDGQLKERWTFVDDELDGVGEIYGPGGRLRQRSHHHRGLRHGTTEVFAADGRLERRVEYERGELLHSWEYDGGGGLYREHDWDGRRMRTRVYDAGKLREERWSLSRDESGTIDDGVTRRWDAQGRLSVEIGYRDGLRAGPSRAYHPNGKVAVEERYEAGQRTARRAYDERGEPIYEAATRQGVGD